MYFHKITIQRIYNSTRKIFGFFFIISSRSHYEDFLNLLTYHSLSFSFVTFILVVQKRSAVGMTREEWTVKKKERWSSKFFFFYVRTELWNAIGSEEEPRKPSCFLSLFHSIQMFWHYQWMTVNRVRFDNSFFLFYLWLRWKIFYSLLTNARRVRKVSLLESANVSIFA